MKIDAHQHFWNYNTHEYSWIDASMQPLQRNFQPEDLRPLLNASGISATVAVEARQTMEETEWLLALAAKHPFIAGVVGYAPLADPQFASLLPGLLQHPKLRGLRHGVQSEPDPHFLRGHAFNAGIRLLAGTGMVFDLLLRSTQLEEAVRFVANHPTQAFVLDHCGKPPIAAGDLLPWRIQIQALAAYPNVSCKISGLVTEADWHSWTPAQLEPVWQTALECFGPERLLFGSDWPVATVAATYQRWVETVEGWLGVLSTQEQAAIWGGNAARIYGL